MGKAVRHKQDFTIGVVISTYNNPEWLAKTLWGYCFQTHPADEFIIADDGSNEETKQLIDSFRDKLSSINHVWHEDAGFRKSMILNKAIVASKADYLIFTDQDCIPRNDFVETHFKNARAGHYLSGGYFKLNMSVSQAITTDDIKTQRVFDIGWLRKNGQPRSSKDIKLVKNKFIARLLNILTPTKPTWNGSTSSGWRKDIIYLNGFNEDMGYGGQDVEFGLRMVNYGIKPKQMRYSAVLLHLDHARPYRIDEVRANNRAIRKHTKENKVIKTPREIDLDKMCSP